MDADARAAAWAAQHHSLISREAARRAGLSDKQIRTRVRSGRWTQLRPGVYAPSGIVETPTVELAAATLALGVPASHRSAAWLHGLLDGPPPRPELTGPSRIGHRAAGIRLHRTDDLAPRDVVSVDSIRCTTAIRTCIDLGARLGEDELEAVIERARHRRLVHLDPLVVRFLQLARPGRNGIATVRAVLRRLDPALEPAESDLETLLIQILRRHGLEPPVRQHVVSIGGRSFRIDLCYPDHRLAIESDGFTDHGLRSAFEDDRARQNLLVLAGWRVLRFTWRQICARPDWVADQVRLALALSG